MRTASADLLAFLNANTVGALAELYTLALENGSTYRWATAESDITLRANRILQSQTLATSPWNTSVPSGTYTRTNGYAAAPDGSTTATRCLVAGSISGSNILRQDVVVQPLTTYTLSWWVKLVSGPTARYSIRDNTGAADIVGVTDYTATTSWSRVSVTFTTPAACVSIQVAPLHNLLATGFEFLLWGVQLETGSAATYYKPTTTAAAGTDRTFTAVASGTAPGARSGSIREAAGMDVGSLAFTLRAGDSALLGSTRVTTAAVQGQLNGARLTVERAILDAPGGTIQGVLTRFEGTVSQVNPSSTVVELEVAPDIEELNREVPRHAFRPACNHTLFDSGCGLARATFLYAETVAAGTTTTSVVLSSSAYPAGFFAGGTITFLTGALAGLKRTIRAHDTGGTVRLAVALPSVPANGDDVELTPGCDKTRQTCSSRFSNLVRFRGFPWVPPPELEA